MVTHSNQSEMSITHLLYAGINFIYNHPPGHPGDLHQKWVCWGIYGVTTKILVHGGGGVEIKILKANGGANVKRMCLNEQ